MTISVFLNVVGFCLGFMAACFFAIGAVFMSPTRITNVARMQWDMNENWAETLCEQRADYIVGAILLVFSFSLQLVAVFSPSDVQSPYFQESSCAIGMIIGIVALLLVISIILKLSISKANYKVVLAKQKQIQRIEELEATKNATQKP